jgi:5-methyltetrahydrofolate--homocysteine methyltransferase
MANLEDIGSNVILGRSDKDSPLYPERIGEPGVKELIEKAIAERVPAQEILTEGLIPGIEEVGERMADQRMFIPEVLQSSAAFKTGAALLKPLLSEDGVRSKGKVIVGTAMGDMHDIGKSLVGMMLEGAGFEVVDLGVNVSTEQFVAAVVEEKPDIVGMSALLTTTMFGMQATIKALEAANLRQSVKVVVGGAPITEQFAREIGADGYAENAGEAMDLMKRLVGVNY